MSKTWVSPVFWPSSSKTGTSKGMICALKRPSSCACAARSWDSSPKRSASPRVTWYFSAIRSAPSNWLVNSKCSK